MAANKSLNDFSEAVSEALQEIAAETFDAIDAGLDKAMHYMRDSLQRLLPKIQVLQGNLGKGKVSIKTSAISIMNA